MKKTIMALLAIFTIGSAMAKAPANPAPRGHATEAAHKKPQPAHAKAHKKPHKRAHKAAHKPAVHKALKKASPKHAVAQR